MQNDAISRSAAIAELKNWLYVTPYDDYQMGFDRALLGAIDRLGNESINPALDVVPVVRCKSCMKRSTFECPMYSEVDGSDYGLDIIINDRTDDDGFCNEGALMDVEEKSKANGGAKNGADV